MSFFCRFPCFPFDFPRPGSRSGVWSVGTVRGRSVLYRSTGRHWSVRKETVSPEDSGDRKGLWWSRRRWSVHSHYRRIVSRRILLDARDRCRLWGLLPLGGVTGLVLRPRLDARSGGDLQSNVQMWWCTVVFARKSRQCSQRAIYYQGRHQWWWELLRVHPQRRLSIRF